MNFTKITTIILFLISIFIIPVNAQVVNGDFETGDYTGWTVTTNVEPPVNHLINLGGIYGNYTIWLEGKYPRVGGWYGAARQDINFTGYNFLEFDESFNYVVGGGGIGYTQVFYGTTNIFQSYSNLHGMRHQSINLSNYQGMGYIYAYANTEKGINIQIDNVILTGEIIDDSFIQFENTPFLEYDNAIVNFSVEKIMNDYPDKRIFLEIATPKITDPYYNYVAYELSDYTGYRGLAIEGKHPTYDAYHNCTAYLRAYESDMSNYETLLEIEEPVLTDNHTLLKYTGYDYPTNKSYITGSYIGIDVDIMDYIETDFLYWPDEHFLLHVNGFSNSNQGNREYEYHIDPKYWNADRYFVKHFSCDVWNIINSDFNSTIESYITVYRNGNTTQLTPTIYTNTYAEGYIPENESGYIPPDIPEPDPDPEIPDPDPEPEPDSDYPIPPNQPNGTYANQTVNVSWTGEYYNIVNYTVDGLGSPIYNFTGWTLSPITKLNSSIGEFNYYMNESFTQTSEDSSILYESINTIYGAIHPKIRNVITYYLIWVVILIILKKD